MLRLFSQEPILRFLKKNKIVKTFYKGSYIAFMDFNQQWQYGIIRRIGKDSVYLRPYTVQFSFSGIDTLSYNESSFSLSDIYAMPKPGVEIGDVKGPHTGQVLTTGGHVHFYWIKGGWIFRAAGIAYASVNLFNALIYKNQPVDWVGLGIAAGLFALGEVLKHTYRPYFKLGKKYSLSTG